MFNCYIKIQLSDLYPEDSFNTGNDNSWCVCPFFVTPFLTTATGSFMKSVREGDELITLCILSQKSSLQDNNRGDV